MSAQGRRRPDPQPAVVAVVEATVTELRRDTAGVLERIGRREAVVVSKHGRPVALLVPLADRESLRPAAPGDDVLAPLVARFAERANERRWSELLHGRWYNCHGIRGEYPCKRRRRRGRRAL